MNKYFFINKALFLKEKGILVIGDLHIGYEHQIIQSGILTPINQIKEIIKELEKIFNKINKKSFPLKKIIFLGDIKHAFNYEPEEKFRFKEVYDFLKKHFKEKDIIFIRGNHDTIDYSFDNKLKDYYITESIAFIHGHKDFEKIYKNKEIKTIIMGHIHPSVVLRDKDTSKKEKYKCFLTGKFKNKQIIILPSFLNISIGQPVNEYNKSYKDYFSIIPRKSLMKFKVHAISKDKVYDFGKVEDL